MFRGGEMEVLGCVCVCVVGGTVASEWWCKALVRACVSAYMCACVCVSAGVEPEW